MPLLLWSLPPPLCTPSPHIEPVTLCIFMSGEVSGAASGSSSHLVAPELQGSLGNCAPGPFSLRSGRWVQFVTKSSSMRSYLRRRASDLGILGMASSMDLYHLSTGLEPIPHAQGGVVVGGEQANSFPRQRA